MGGRRTGSEGVWSVSLYLQHVLLPRVQMQASVYWSLREAPCLQLFYRVLARVLRKT
jgi:hypothetical protein